MRNNAPSQVSVGELGISLASDQGWYLYGITRHSDSSEESNCSGQLGLYGEPVQTIPQGGLLAIVSLVPLAKFGPEAIRARLQDMAWLETMACSHDQVVEEIHRERTIVPAKFGCVYATKDDLATSLRDAHHVLLTLLECFEGCDEWGVRVYADRSKVQELIAQENAATQQLQQELAAVKPGRAYFLKSKLADLLTTATDQALNDRAQAAYSCLAHFAVAGQISPRHDVHYPMDKEVEILRAALLVPRDKIDAFIEEIHRVAEGQEGTRCEYSGPWPPYSFTAPSEVRSR